MSAFKRAQQVKPLQTTRRGRRPKPPAPGEEGLRVGLGFLVVAGPLGQQFSLDVARLVAKLDQERDVAAEAVVGLPSVLVATPGPIVKQPDSEEHADQVLDRALALDRLDETLQDRPNPRSLREW